MKKIAAVFLLLSFFATVTFAEGRPPCKKGENAGTHGCAAQTVDK